MLLITCQIIRACLPMLLLVMVVYLTVFSSAILFRLINEPDLDSGVREKYYHYITNCATVMAENAVNPKTMLFGGDWWNAPGDKDPVGLTPMLSGCMLMEAMCILKPLPKK